MKRLGSHVWLTGFMFPDSRVGSLMESQQQLGKWQHRLKPPIETNRLVDSSTIRSTEIGTNTFFFTFSHFVKADPLLGRPAKPKPMKREMVAARSINVSPGTLRKWPNKMPTIHQEKALIKSLGMFHHISSTSVWKPQKQHGKTTFLFGLQPPFGKNHLIALICMCWSYVFPKTLSDCSRYSSMKVVSQLICHLISQHHMWPCILMASVCVCASAPVPKGHFFQDGNCGDKEYITNVYRACNSYSRRHADCFQIT